MTDELVLSLLDSPLSRDLLDPATWRGHSGVRVQAATSMDANSRGVLRGEFGVAEMSFATFLRGLLVDGLPLRALPFFTGRRFTQPLMGARDPGLQPRDLIGRRVAAPQYWMTSSVWHRQVLATYYGVDPTSLTWVTTVPERFDLEPAGVQVELNTGGRTPAQLVSDGVADVLLQPGPVEAPLHPLFEDPVAAQERYRADTGILPIMHLVVVRTDVLERRPEVVATACEALTTGIRRSGAAMPMLGLPLRASAALVAEEQPWGPAIGPLSRRSVDALLAWAPRDGLVPVAPELGEVFVGEDALAGILTTA